MRTSWTSIAVRPRLWMSSMPSLSVRPLHDSGIPEGPKRIMNSPPTKKPPLDYYSGLPDINIFASAPGFGRGRGALPHEPAVAPQGPNCPWLSPLWRPQTLKSLRSFGVRPRPIFMAKTPKTNPHLQQVVRELREDSRQADSAIWRDGGEGPGATGQRRSNIRL